MSQPQNHEQPKPAVATLPQLFPAPANAPAIQLTPAPVVQSGTPPLEF